MGFTLPQSVPLKTDLEITVHSTGVAFGPLCIVPAKCILPLATLPSGQEEEISPLPFIFPLHARSAVMLVACRTTLAILQSRWFCDIGAPYLSIISWVRQTCVVMVVPLKGFFMPAGMVMPAGIGDFCQAMLVVISQRPGVLRSEERR